MQKLDGFFQSTDRKLNKNRKENRSKSNNWK